MFPRVWILWRISKFVEVKILVYFWKNLKFSTKFPEVFNTILNCLPFSKYQFSIHYENFKFSRSFSEFFFQKKWENMKFLLSNFRSFCFLNKTSKFQILFQNFISKNYKTNLKACWPQKCYTGREKSNAIRIHLKSISVDVTFPQLIAPHFSKFVEYQLIFPPLRLFFELTGPFLIHFQLIFQDHSLNMRD